MEQETTIHQRLEKPKKEERMLGMDVLKILSMFMVLLLHVNGAGGILWNATTFETHWWIAGVCWAECFCLRCSFT